MITELLVFGSKNFNNSIEEIKGNLGYSTLFFDFNKSLPSTPLSIACVIVDGQVFKSEIVFCEEVAGRLGYKKGVIGELSSKIYSDPSITADRESLKKKAQKFLK